MIGPGDPPPYSIINQEGKASVLLVGDHASNIIPGSLDNLGLMAPSLQQHIAYDIGSEKLVHHLSQHLDAPAVVAGYSRLVIDLNRNLEDPTAIPEVSDNTVVRGNQNLSQSDRDQRIAEFYTPYHGAIDEMLADFERRDITPAFLAIHSFTPQMAGFSRPWHAGILWDLDPRIPLPLMENLRAYAEGFNIGDNEPYSGKELADFTVDHHAETRGLPHVSIEIRQDLIDSEAGAERWAQILADAFDDILADPKLYSRMAY